MNKNTNVALEAAKEQGADNIRVLNGVRVRILSVPQFLIDDAVNRIVEPQVPIVMDETKGYKDENPDDPRYIREYAQYERAQADAAIDAAIIFGMELVDGLPKNNIWLRKLQFLAKRKRINLNEYDLDDELDRTFLYIRYVVLNAKILNELLPEIMIGVTKEDVDAAQASFQGDEK